MATEFNDTTENLSDNRALVRSVPPDEAESTATTNTDFRQQAQAYGKPVQAIAITAAAGVILGLILGRRR